MNNDEPNKSKENQLLVTTKKKEDSNSDIYNESHLVDTTLKLPDETKVSPKTQCNNKKTITLVTTQKHDSSIDKLSGVHMDSFV